nr:MAG TPA: hypothetical protein [Bacteriophage sp.]
MRLEKRLSWACNACIYNPHALRLYILHNEISQSGAIAQ